MPLFSYGDRIFSNWMRSSQLSRWSSLTMKYSRRFPIGQSLPLPHLLHPTYIHSFYFSLCVIDEAHRLKNRNCKLLTGGLSSFRMEHSVLLTGTPLQNNMEELFSLLHFLHPAQFSSSQAFLDQFGQCQTDEQVLYKRERKRESGFIAGPKTARYSEANDASSTEGRCGENTST